MTKVILMIAVLLIPICASSQTEQETDPWQTIRFLEGTWQGNGDGMSGHSDVTQKYEFVLGGKFIRMTTKAVFEPQDKNSKGEVHEDLAMFSYDSGRKMFVLRAFYVEGFVNTYVLDDISEDGKTLTFNTEHVENGPPGTTARLVFEQTGDNEIEQSFFVAFPGSELSCFSKNLLKKL